MLEPGPDLYPQKNLVNAALARNCHFERSEKSFSKAFLHCI
jgi:hypothetical protein